MSKNKGTTATAPAAATKSKGKSKPEKPEGADSLGRVLHPTIGSKDPNVYPWTKVPDDFDPNKHKPYRKKDFVEEAQFHEARAEYFEKRAQKARENAEKARTLGSGEQRKTRKKLQRVAEQYESLLATLKAEGVDTDALLAEIKASGVEDEEVAAA